jgi:hypothetical protein
MIIRILVVILSMSLTGCAVHHDTYVTDVISKSHRLFLTVEWYGPNSRLFPEAGFATESELHLLQGWLALRSDSRRAFLINEDECLKVRDLLGSSEFLERQTPKVQDSIYQRPQYVMIVRSWNVERYYPLGFDKSTRALLLALKGAVQGSSEDALDPLITIFDIR